jgi:AcrR family transcriptional regulator
MAGKPSPRVSNRTAAKPKAKAKAKSKRPASPAKSVRSDPKPRQSGPAANARVLAAALVVVQEEGVSALTARRVAADAGISVGGVYNLFGSLDGLVVACKEAVLADLRDHLARAAREGVSCGVEERLLMLADAYVSYADASPLAWSSLFEHAAEIGPGAVEERTRAVFSVLEGILADLPGLPEARRPLMARAIWSAVHGIVYLGRRGNLGPVRRENVPAMIRVLVGALVAGLSGPETA